MNQEWPETWGHTTFQTFCSIPYDTQKSLFFPPGLKVTRLPHLYCSSAACFSLCALPPLRSPLKAWVDRVPLSQAAFSNWNLAGWPHTPANICTSECENDLWWQKLSVVGMGLESQDWEAGWPEGLSNTTCSERDIWMLWWLLMPLPACQLSVSNSRLAHGTAHSGSCP